MFLGDGLHEMSLFSEGKKKQKKNRNQKRTKKQNYSKTSSEIFTHAKYQNAKCPDQTRHLKVFLEMADVYFDSMM